ncbi:GGDEF domain-containing protein [Glaciecola sp. MH2013]|uniref:GGDEF domain-containing protein n=1 Tax=Glaciecola sp. MH2013 TaxID=2785524 RepID=UPI00189DDB14|nr:GGDEF domain-containing protein [Glaciecola sp. MH2013]MBF7074280.1 GGDEF domain-containing protein [Glaciecola sp. MH2013]
MPDNQNLDIDFLVKAGQRMSTVALALLIPFTVNHIYQERYLAAVLVSIAAALCGINLRFSLQKRFSLPLNLLGIMPAMTIGVCYALYNQQEEGSYWAYLGVFAIYFVLPLKYAVITNVVYVCGVILVAYFNTQLNMFIRFSTVLVGISFFSYISNKELSAKHETLEKLLNFDVLTKAFNRRQLSSSLRESYELFYEKKQISCIAIVDIDHFKRINDTHGHPIGDQVLKQFAAIICSYLSSKDKLFRIGGEEFLILMENTELSEANGTTTALCEVIKAHNFPNNIKVTISAGICTIEEAKTEEKLIEICDKKLYQAKSNGRDQIVC